jgi:hypothetical protein
LASLSSSSSKQCSINADQFMNMGLVRTYQHVNKGLQETPRLLSAELPVRQQKAMQLKSGLVCA